MTAALLYAYLIAASVSWSTAQPMILRMNGVETCIAQHDFAVKWTAECVAVGPCYCPPIPSGDWQILDDICRSRCSSKGQYVENMQTRDGYLVRCDCAIDL